MNSARRHAQRVIAGFLVLIILAVILFGLGSAWWVLVSGIAGGFAISYAIIRPTDAVPERETLDRDDDSQTPRFLS
jgi:hypothetical protein